MSGREQAVEKAQTAVDFIRRLVGAWDCCGTCAGGVLLRHDREVKAQAWDEGYATCLGDFDIAARREARSPNPHRTPPADSP